MLNLMLDTSFKPQDNSPMVKTFRALVHVVAILYGVEIHKAAATLKTIVTVSRSL